jgi:hypothetical protein
MGMFAETAIIDYCGTVYRWPPKENKHMDTWTLVRMGTWTHQTEAQAIFLNPVNVCSSCK